MKHVDRPSQFCSVNTGKGGGCGGYGGGGGCDGGGTAGGAGGGGDGSGDTGGEGGASAYTCSCAVDTREYSASENGGPPVSTAMHTLYVPTGSVSATLALPELTERAVP